MKWNEYCKPIVVLLAICLVISAALAFTNEITAPIIADAANAEANAARALVLPGGKDYEKLDLQFENVADVYKETSGLGYAITATGSGYGGTMSVMVGFDSSTGLISGVRVLAHGESKGIGTNAVENQDYIDRYIGQDENLAVDSVSGATYSSKGLKSAIAAAYAAYDQLKEGV